MLAPDVKSAAAVEAAILEDDYETAAALIAAICAEVDIRAVPQAAAVRECRDWLQHLLITVQTQRGHLSHRLAQLRSDGYGRVTNALHSTRNASGWVGCIALLGCLLTSGLYAADQKSALERQIGAAKRQQEAVKAQRSSGSFFQTPWLNEITAQAQAASAESSASQSPGNGSYEAPAADCPRIQAEELEQMIARASLGPVSPKLVSAVIAQESGGKPCVVSHKGAIGLMQIMPELASEMKVADPFDPEQNLEAGVRYLSQLMDRYRGDLRLVLAAYNAGPARVDNSGGVPDIEETKAYVTSVLQRIQR